MKKCLNNILKFFWLLGKKKKKILNFRRFFFYLKKEPIFHVEARFILLLFQLFFHLPIGKNGLCLCAVAHPSSAHPNSVVDLISNSIWTQPIQAHTGQHIFKRLFLYGPYPLGIWFYLKMFFKKFSLLFLKQKKIFKFKIFLTCFFFFFKCLLEITFIYGGLFIFIIFYIISFKTTS